MIAETRADYSGKLAVLYEGQGDLSYFQQLAVKLGLRLISGVDAAKEVPEPFFFALRDGCLKLLDKELLKKGGLSVNIAPRSGEQRSWPAPKQGPLAQALGRKTKTIVDATAGWGQDCLCMFRMGYDVLCLERSLVMAELLADGFNRLLKEDWIKNLGLLPPRLVVGDAIEILGKLEYPPDCVFIDPMFPPKRKKSALAKKSMAIIHDLVGGDPDKERLFTAAFDAAAKRVVVKSPDYAEPLGGKPNESFQGKLLRYDVYFKS
ncbi:MAG: class I SAM-dependent methyltransferase [Gammaproteobacteria bacterium]